MRNTTLMLTLVLACDQSGAKPADAAPKTEAKSDKRTDTKPAVEPAEAKAATKAATKAETKAETKADPAAKPAVAADAVATCTSPPGALTSRDGEQLAGLTNVYRIPGKPDEHGRIQPPYAHAEFGALLPKPVACGEKLTVIALAGWAPITVPVIEVVASDLDSGVQYEAKARSTDKEFLEGAPIKGRAEDVPTEVVVLFPASDKAKLLPTGTSPAGLKPKGKLTAVVDIDGSGDADLAFSAKRLGDLGDCTYQYRRDGAAWKLLEEACPD